MSPPSPCSGDTGEIALGRFEAPAGRQAIAPSTVARSLGWRTIAAIRDPHVVALYYRMLTDESVSFTDPPPVEWETDAFRARLQDGVARFELIEHYPSAEAARERVEAIRPSVGG